MKKMKRILAMLLCVLMTCSGPLGVFAEEGTSEEIVEQTACNCETTTEEHAETCPKYVKPEAKKVCEICQKEVCVCDENKESTVQTLEEELPECNCQTTNEIHAESCPKYVDPEPPKVCETCQQEVCVCEQVENEPDEQKEGSEPILTVAEQILATESVEEMYLVVLDFMQNDPEALKELTAEEIEALRIRVNELDPEGDDVDTEDLLDTLAILPNGGEELEGDPVMLQTNNIASNQTWFGNTSLSEDTTWNFQNGAIVTLKNPITIPNGKTLTLTGWGGFARHSDNVKEIFIVNTGGKLVIKGSSGDNTIVIDGKSVIDGKRKSVIAERPLITSSGTLDFRYAVIQDGKNRASLSRGGGIVIGTGSSMTMDSCVVTHNTAKEFGGGIYCAGSMTINNSVISYNIAATDSAELTNKGRGGGFEVTGSNASCILNNTIIEENHALYYGGGGQVDNHATITMNGETIFRNNKALLHGAGALHLTEDATFIMNGGSMEGNFAQYCGGAIHSSYSCVLELNAGEIKNNETNGRGGGIHINTGGAITLNENITISGNRANKQKVGTSADVDHTGDSITNIKYEGPDTDFGYGGGILIDSGTCTVAGATITNNYAEVGGGGIALTMLNMGKEGLDDLMVIKFTMTAGTVSNNTTDGNGAGVYIMTNKAENNLKNVFPEDATEENYQWALNQITENNKHEFTGEDIIKGIPEAVVSGGTIQNNVATNNGGGLYLGENTKFIINGGAISENKAVDGAGVYVASGVAEINGGTMTANVASSEGGALYIEGDVIMTNGTVGGTTETAANMAVNGGAMYVTNGNVTIKHGAINGNKAVGSGNLQDTTNNTGRGGAVYLAGDTKTLLTMESGTMNQNTATNDGGAIFATGGTIWIGLAGCSGEQAGEECNHHTDLGSERHHPIINANKAGDTGGGIALTNGVVQFYCGKAKENQALYKGVGKNVFMDGGKFHLYDGADVGIPRDTDLVIVGGELYNECEYKEYLNLYYYFQNTDTTTQMQGLAELNEVMNLPDGEYFWDAPEGHVFLGWTAQGAASVNQSNEYVRNKEQYVNSGDPVEILDAISSETDQTAQNTNRLFDGKSDKTLHLYALWVPEKSNITYVNGMTGKIIPNTDTDPDNPKTYDFKREPNIVQIQPVKHAGYDLVGWYIYQDADQNANWNDTQIDYENLKYEPNYKDKDYSTQKTYIELDSRNGVLSLEAGNTNFGNITLIARFEPAYADLKIKKTGWQTIDENQTFIFKIIGTPYNNEDFPSVELEAVIKGNGEVIIEHLPLGTYKIEELADWSWRYESVVEKDGQTSVKSEKTVALDNSTTDFSVEFTNRRTNPNWLDGSSHAQNIFAPESISSSGNIYQKGGN